MSFKTFIILVLSAAMMISTAQAADTAKDLPQPKRTKLGLYMTPQQAFGRMEKQADKTLFIDIRTRAEVTFLGMPTIADANIPYMEEAAWADWDEKKGTFKLSPNSDFSLALAERLSKKGLTKKDTIILMCRSGDRSAKAADALAAIGYENVYSITEGFEGDVAKDGVLKGQRAVNGWKNAKLPWSYKLDKAKMYEVGG